MDFDRLKYSVWIQKCVHPNVDTKFENADTDADTDVGTDLKKKSNHRHGHWLV